MTDERLREIEHLPDELLRMAEILRPQIGHSTGCTTFLPYTNPASDFCDCRVGQAVKKANGIFAEARKGFMELLREVQRLREVERQFRELLREPHFQGAPYIPQLGKLSDTAVMVSRDWYERLKQFPAPPPAERK